jgi:hypothetical protein
MKAIGLFLVLVFAHGLGLAGSTVPVSPWTPVALLWQDAAVALAFAAVDRFLKSVPGVAWGLYGVLVAYAAVNVPVAWVLASPLTPPMLRAARGPLWDSVAHYFTLANVGAVLLVATAGFLATRLPMRIGPRAGTALAAAGCLVVVLGPYAVSQTGGGHRNAFGALWPARGPEVFAVGFDRDVDWRTSPFGSGRGRDLSRYRGTAAGRNVVLMLLESTGSRYLAPYGFDRDPTPYLTALSRKSVLFETAYAVYPESIKGLLPVLCSVYPAFGIPAGAYADFPCSSIAAELSASGYRTALVHSGRFAYLGMRAIVENRGFEVLEDAGSISGNVNSSFGVDEPAAIDRIFSWIDSLDSDDRFFLTYLPIAGHHPYATPEPGPFPADNEFDRYLNALHYGDRALGALLDGLVARGLYESTLFVVFGDHGEAFGQQEGNFGHSFFIYDTNVRVPYLIAIPGVTEEQARVPNPASVIDTAPTILDLLGLPVPDAYQGASLLDGRSRMALFYTDYALGWLGLYDTCWKYIFQTDSERSELYDVCNDPDEARDLSSREPERVGAYKKRVGEWAAAQVASMRER